MTEPCPDEVRYPAMSSMPLTLPPLTDQAARLIELGLHHIAGVTAEQLRQATHGADTDHALLALHPQLAPASTLVRSVTVSGKPAFVVTDMSDVDEFSAAPPITLPDVAVYAVDDVDRGDAMANWSPDEALPALTGAGRTPLTLTEGLHWLLQRPATLQRGHCFMTIGARRYKADGSLDARTPALWFSNGTGRDGAANRNAPKVGWCWAGNRHTWLGIASAETRRALP